MWNRQNTHFIPFWNVEGLTLTSDANYYHWRVIVTLLEDDDNNNDDDDGLMLSSSTATRVMTSVVSPISEERV